MMRCVLVVSAAVAGGAAVAQPTLPDEIVAFTRESLDACRGAGGTPSLQGLAFPGAGTTPEVHSPYLTDADLNADGRPDYISDLAGLECENAWSYFCGSAGCPVTVWLSGPGGYAAVPAGNVQAWRRDGAALVLSVHGQLCTPPRVGADGCDLVMRFEGQEGTIGDGAASASAVAPSASSAPAPLVSPRPRGRPEAAAAVAAPAPGASGAATLPKVAPAAGPSAWTYGQMPDRSGWFAGVRDDASGRRVDWLCAKGRQSLLAVSPWGGGARIAIDVGGRVQAYDVQVSNGAAYAPVDLTQGIFIHLLSGPAITISEPGGPVLGTFSMEGAPLAIGQAEGRCRV